MEGEATRLCIYFEFAETEESKIPDEVVEFVEEVFEKYDLYPERIDDYNIYSEYFPDSDANMDRVDEIESLLQEEFGKKVINRHTVSEDYYDIPPGAYQTWMSIKSLPEGLEVEASSTPGNKSGDEEDTKSAPVGDMSDYLDRGSSEKWALESDSGIDWRTSGSESSSQRKCPECGGSTARGEKGEQTVCTECGFVLENPEQGMMNSDQEASAFEPTEDSSDVDKNPPENVADWEMWYPCPACGSTGLNQIIEQNLAVSATKDGAFGGDDLIESNQFIECDNCGQVLLDEIDKS